MNKSEFINALSRDLGWSKAKTGRVMDEFLNLISEILIKRGRVSLSKFGIFTVKHRTSREGRNPRTGEKILIPPRDYVHFKASKSLTDAVNKR